MQVEQFLENSARLYPEKVALIHGRERLTYRQIDTEANRIAHALIEAGVTRGDRVVIFVPNSVEAVLSIFATLKAGAVFVVLNATTKPDKLTYILNNCRASAMIAWGGRLPAEASIWTETPNLRSLFLIEGSDAEIETIRFLGKGVVRVEEIRKSTIEVPPPTKTCIDIDLAALIYTSGSTGRPKGVMVTHLNVVSAATSITTYLENTADDVVINIASSGLRLRPVPVADDVQIGWYASAA